MANNEGGGQIDICSIELEQILGLSYIFSHQIYHHIYARKKIWPMYILWKGVVSFIRKGSYIRTRKIKAAETILKYGIMMQSKEVVLINNLKSFISNSGIIWHQKGSLLTTEWTISIIILVLHVCILRLNIEFFHYEPGVRSTPFLTDILHYTFHSSNLFCQLSPNLRFWFYPIACINMS